MSHWNPVEVLESRTLLAATPLDWPLRQPGVARIGRTLYIAGTDANDQINIDVPTATADRADKIQVVFNGLRVNGAIPVLLAAPLRKVLINGAGGIDNINIATGITNKFQPKVINIRGGAGNDTINGGNRNENIFGEAGDDTINGGGGRDRIDGGDGNDNITGGAGRDILFGRLGDDTFKNREPTDQRPATGPGSPADLVLGGDGSDNAQADPADRILADVENPNAA